MKEALLYKKLPDKNVQCQNCAHYCVIPPGKRGICGVRENIDSKLYTLNYEKAIAVNIDPIEKKPLFHFLPGSHSLSIATVGCQFSCLSCQNWQISQGPKITKTIEGEKISPKEVIKITLKNKLPSISYTYTDPIVFSEYALDIMKLAKKEKIKNIWVTSGFFSKELFDLISPYLDAANIDLKGFTDEFYQKYCGGRLQPVLDTLKKIKEKGIWLEVTTLVIPTLNDSEEVFQKIANFIKNELGKETPWHITQFCGAISWKLQYLPDTPIETLKKAYQISKKAGLKYVYTGNIPGLSTENTYCPKCNQLVIERIGYIIKRYDKNGYCPKCHQSLDIIE
ncbi:AmmeMemoRadiSam system radical SAM enzyme [bacterium]|nr:AmmeMemoRadiSam system radical SAM enzyme [bacterium]